MSITSDDSPEGKIYRNENMADQTAEGTIYIEMKRRQTKQQREPYI